MSGPEEGAEQGGSQAWSEGTESAVLHQDGGGAEQPNDVGSVSETGPSGMASGEVSEKPGDEQDSSRGGPEDGYVGPSGTPSSPIQGREAESDAQAPPDWEIDWAADWPASAEMRRHGLAAHRSAMNFGGGPAFYVERASFGDGGDAEGIEPLSFASVTEQDVIGQMDVHQYVQGHTEMFRHLMTHRLVVLAGLPGSGRGSTGIALLQGCRRTITISVVRSDGGLVRNLAKQSRERLRGDAGYVVHAGSEQITQEMVEGLLSVVRDGAFLVLIGELPLLDVDELQSYVFHHPGPDLKAVLRAHLDDRLATHMALCESPTEDKCTAEAIAAYADWVMADQQANRILDLETSVQGVVQSATELASLVHAGDAERAEVIGQWRFRARRTAKLILREAGSTDGPLLDPHRQAFCIAYTVFHGRPLADAFLAGEMLSREILPLFETRESEPTFLVFDRKLDALIPPRMRVQSGHSSTGGKEDNPRLALLVDEKLLDAILEVVWHDYDSLRRPMMLWLDALANQKQQRIRFRAAEIAGILLRYDFESVYRDLVLRWARSTSASRRQCAALAFEMASLGEQGAKRSRRQVLDLAGSSRFEFQDTAARSYGTRLGLQDVTATLAALRALAVAPKLVSSGSVALSMGWLCFVGFLEPVIKELDSWISSGKEPLVRHAARTLLILARLTRDSEREGRPVLAELALESTEHRQLLVKLWREALTTSGVSERAWSELRRWLLGAEANGDLALLLERLAPIILTGKLQPRARFHLALWQQRHPDSKIIRRIRQSLG